jgi:DNA-binding beta-propeller fold protein YncE
LYDESQNRLFVVDQGFAAPLIEVDEATGNRTLLTNSAVGLGINFKGPWGIVLDPANHTAFVTDIVADIVVAVNLDDGSRQLIAGSPTGRGTIATDPIAVDVDAAEAQLYIVDFTENSLYSLDLATGARRTISDATTGSGPVLENPIDVAVDPTAGVVYVLDALLDALLSVDRASGDRRIVASGFGGPAGCAVDRDNGVAYVSTGFGDVIRVDLSSGQQTVVSSNLVGAGPRLGQIGDLALDAKHGRLIALDRYPNRVFSIDIATGDRRIASGPGTNGSEAGGGPSLELPRAVEVDPSRGIAYVTDDLYNAVIAVDLASGFRQVVAR